MKLKYKIYKDGEKRGNGTVENLEIDDIIAFHKDLSELTEKYRK